MQETGLPPRIRRGVVEAKVSSDGEWFGKLARAARGRPSRERDRALHELVVGYRQRRGGAGEAILELVLPALLARLAGFRPQLPAIDDDDLTQQPVLEILAAALSMPLQGPAFLERRLVPMSCRPSTAKRTSSGRSETTSGTCGNFPSPSPKDW